MSVPISGPARACIVRELREALIVVWEASDRICSKRLRPLLPILVEAMERHGHVQLVPEVRQITGDERGDDRSGIARCPAASGTGNTPPVSSFGGDQAQRAGAHV